jgi:hypothetical protein
MHYDLAIYSTKYFAPAIIILGLFGNLFGLIVISKKKLKKIGPQITYIALFISDFFNFLLIFQSFTQFEFNFDITLFSNFACKTYWYLNFALGPISPMLNVYISIERYISVAHSSKKHFLLKKQIQFAFIIAVTMYNLILYIPFSIYDSLFKSNQTNQTVCDMDPYLNYVYNIIDLVNRVIIPFLLMIIFSILIIYTIFSSRRRISSNNAQTNRSFRRDIRFSLIIILLNISFIVLSLPVTLLVFVSDYWLHNFLFNFFNYIYFLSFCTNFYLMFAVNSFFRGGFYSIFICSNKIQSKRQVINQPNNISIKRNITTEKIRTKEAKRE